MIYLIGGPSRSGKSTLASMVAAKTGAQLLPMDYIESAITEWYPKDKDKEKVMRPFSYMRNATDRDNAKLVQQYSAEQIVEAYTNQGESTWESINAMINYGIAVGDNVIIEGYQITPDFLHKILNQENAAFIKAVFLLKEDEGVILKGWEENVPDNDWLLKNSSKETLSQYAHVTAMHGKVIKQAAEQFGFNYVTTDKDFSVQLNKALSCLQ